MADNPYLQQQEEQQAQTMQATTGDAQPVAWQMTEDASQLAATELAAGGGTASVHTDAAAQEAQRQRQADGETGEEGEAAERHVCSHCSANSTSSNWRRHPTTRERLCYRCREYMRNHNGEERPVGVRCLLCNSHNPGATKGAYSVWRPHPSTGERWLCGPCFFEARWQAGQEQQEQQEGGGEEQQRQQKGQLQQRAPHLQQEGAAEQAGCSHCGTNSSSIWKRHPTTGQRLCCSCRDYMRNHEGKEKPVGMRCICCASSSPGPHSNSAWRPHPTTGQRWLCSPCFFELRRQARQEQPEQQEGAGKKQQRQQKGQMHQRAPRQQQEGAAEQAGCSHCGANSATSWRRHPTTGQRLCNRCREYMRHHNGEEKPVGVCCLLCNSDSPGAGVGQNGAWRPHPTTGQRWLCGPCSFEERRQAKQGQQDKDTMGQQKQQRQQQELARQLGQQAGAAEQATCSHCGTGSTSRWYRHPTTGQRLCCSCLNYMRNHNGEEKPVGLHCLLCNSGSPGPHSNSAWRVHPTTSEHWLCSPCFFRARRQAQQASGKQADMQLAGQSSGQHDGQRAASRSSSQPERRCLDCHASSPGCSKAADWHQHPAAALEWLCERCFSGVQQQQERMQHDQLSGKVGDLACAPLPAQPSSFWPPAEETAHMAAQGKQQAKRPATGGSVGDGRAGAKRQRQRMRQQPEQLGEQAEGAEEGGDALQAAPRQQGPQQTPDLFSLLLGAARVPAAAACGLTPELAAPYCELLVGLPAAQRAPEEGSLRQLLQCGLHSAAQQVMSATVKAASHGVTASSAGLQPSTAALRTAEAGGGELPTPQALQAQPELPESGSAAAGGQPPEQPQPQAQISLAHRQPQQAQQACAELQQAQAETQQVQQAPAEAQQAQLALSQPQQARQAAPEPQQAQQDLFHLLMHAARSAAGAAAGLTPELAASFMMLMHRLAPGERAEKETQLRALLGWGLHGAAAQAIAAALHFGLQASGGAPP